MHQQSKIAVAFILASLRKYWDLQCKYNQGLNEVIVLVSAQNFVLLQKISENNTFFCIIEAINVCGIAFKNDNIKRYLLYPF